MNVGRDVTIVVVPRERFSFTRESLESIYAQTPQPFELVYVDGGSPAPIRHYLEAQSAQREFTLLRSARYLSPNAARNLGLRCVRTPYVAFVDNDVIVQPQWLERLLACAEETGAAIVGPLCNIELGGALSVHIAGGDAHIALDRGMRVCVESHFRAGEPPGREPAHQRSECELVEFHTMLVRTEFFNKAGPLDEALRSVNEHVDLCMTARALGDTVYFEPGSVVTYVPAERLDFSDLPFFMLRWSERWNDATARHFIAKWELDPQHPQNREIVRYGRFHRRRGLRIKYDATESSWRARACRRAAFVSERLFNVAYTALPYRP